MNLKTILVGTDFSPPAARAVELALGLARARGATLLVAHAHPKKEANLNAYEISAGRVEAFRQTLRRALEEAERRLSGERERLAAEGVESRALLLDLPADHSLCAAAEEHGADLVVVGERGQGGLRRLLLGSTAEKVARGCRAPVLVARGGQPAEGFRRILVPVDFSELSLPSLGAALAVASPGAEVELLHCLDLSHGHLDEGQTLLAELEGEMRQDADRRARKLIDAVGAPDASVSHQTMVAGAARGILERLDEEAFDLVVLGSRGRGAIQRYLLGSATSAALRHAPCPVLVLHPRPA